jgi:hypothetical protein
MYISSIETCLSAVTNRALVNALKALPYNSVQYSVHTRKSDMIYINHYFFSSFLEQSDTNWQLLSRDDIQHYTVRVHTLPCLRQEGDTAA